LKQVMAAKGKRHVCGAYGALCDWVQGRGGKVRLGRAGQSFMLVVDAPPGLGSSRVAGYAFTDIAELDGHAQLILNWLRRLEPATT
jgi:hypothetical protein